MSNHTAATVRPCMACTHQHQPDASGACYEVPCVDECATCAEVVPGMVTRYALRTVTEQPGPALYVYALAQYTMPAATDNEAQARTWASARGAMTAARRHGLTNVEPVAVRRLPALR